MAHAMRLITRRDRVSEGRTRRHGTSRFFDTAIVDRIPFIPQHYLFIGAL